MTMNKDKLKISLHFFEWRCPCFIYGHFQHIRGKKERAIRGRKAFIDVIKKYNIASSSIFDGIGKLKSGIWGLLPRIMRISDTLPLLVSPDMLNHRAIN